MEKISPAILKFVPIILLPFSIYGCADKTEECLDGWGEESYLPSPDGQINITSYNLTTPQSVLETRIAYTQIKCGKIVAYFIKQNDEFKNVTELEFSQYINSYNDSCRSCLNVYKSGCC